MRINQWLAKNTVLSRRKADVAVSQSRVKINGQFASLGSSVGDTDVVTLDDKEISRLVAETILVLLNKPVGYVCSRLGQGSKTIYDLLPEEYKNYNPVGRLDKDSSGLLLLTNDGNLLNELAHPANNKQKTYQINLDKPLSEEATNRITRIGVDIGDSRVSRFEIEPINGRSGMYEVVLEEGRNRQIRRTFDALGYKVTKLHRTQFGKYKLVDIGSGDLAEFIVK